MPQCLAHHATKYPLSSSPNFVKTKPLTYSQFKSYPQWQQAIQDEINALLAKQTWTFNNFIQQLQVIFPIHNLGYLSYFLIVEVGHVKDWLHLSQ